ncbi:MAG TPA: hypothetical protein ENL43_01895 [candidate division WOR-3 bacterium]|uniref:Uncharacterized protein n=1 Tax=candidate division WOR-3 bacterium TaxID=2052148 RepID=A0A7V5LTA4_UNCW3|nr:hypothetical protein [candidate division WOR-3 bacterium]
MNFLFQSLVIFSLILPLSPDDYREYPENYFKVSGLGGLNYRGILLDTTGYYLPLFPEFHFYPEKGYIYLKRDTLERAIPETQLFSRRGGAYYTEIGGGFITRLGLRELEAALYFSSLKESENDRNFHYAEMRYLGVPQINIFYFTPGERNNYAMDLRFPWVHFSAGRGITETYQISLFPWKQVSLGIKAENSIYTVKMGYGSCMFNLQKEEDEFTPGFSLEWRKNPVFLWTEYGKRYWYERPEEALRVSVNASLKYFLAFVYYKRALRNDGKVYFWNSEDVIDSSRSSLDLMGEIKIPVVKLLNFSGAFVYNSHHSNPDFIVVINKSLSFRDGEVMITPELIWSSRSSYLKFLLSVVLFKAMEIQYIQYMENYRFTIGARLFD